MAHSSTQGKPRVENVVEPVNEGLAKWAGAQLFSVSANFHHHGYRLSRSRNEDAVNTSEKALAHGVFKTESPFR